MIARLVTLVVSTSLLLMTTFFAFGKVEDKESMVCVYEKTVTDSHETGDAENNPSPAEEDSSEQEDDDDKTKFHSPARTYSAYAYQPRKATLNSFCSNSYFPEIVSPPPQF